MAAPPAGAQTAAAAEPDVEVVSLRAALAESESQLASARDAIFALSTGRRVLVQEVLELRALLAGQGSQRQYDSLATRDAALEKLEAREAQVRELQVTVKELQGQLHRQQLALRVGHELSREVRRFPPRASSQSRPQATNPPRRTLDSLTHVCMVLPYLRAAARRRHVSPRSRARRSSWPSSRRTRCARRRGRRRRRRAPRRRSGARSKARWPSSSGARSVASRRGDRPRSTPPPRSCTRRWVAVASEVVPLARLAACQEQERMEVARRQARA